MELTDIRGYIEEEVDAPVDRETVMDRVGSVEIDCPTGDSDRIAEALGMDDTRRYETTAEICHSVMCYLSGGYVGRRFYDDRSPNMLDRCSRDEYDDDCDPTAVGGNVCF